MTGNRMTKEEHTIISILLVTFAIVGRKDGLGFQHSPHILHHSSVKFSTLGRSGGPLNILFVTFM